MIPVYIGTEHIGNDTELMVLASKYNENPDKVFIFQADCAGCPGNATVCHYARMASLIGPFINRHFPNKHVVGIQFSKSKMVRVSYR